MAVDALIKAIRDTRDLAEQNRLKDALKQELAGVTTLKSNNLMDHGGLFGDATDLNNLGAALATNTNITALELSDWYRSPGPTRFLNEIKNNTTLTALKLESWKLDKSEAEALAYLLEHGKIKKFSISCLPDKPMDPALFSILTEALSKNTTIEKLTLYWFAGDEMAKNLIKIIRANHTLTEITIHGQSPTQNREQLAKIIENSEIKGFHWFERRDNTTPEWEAWNEQLYKKRLAKEEAARNAERVAREAKSKAEFEAKWAAEEAERAAQRAAREAERIATIEKDVIEITSTMDSSEVKNRLFPLLERMGENPTDHQKTLLKDALNKLNTLYFYSLTNVTVRPSLSHITLTQASIKHLFEALQNNKSITTLTLDNVDIGHDAFHTLSKILLNNRNIHNISLSHNQIGFDSFDDLLKIMKSNPDSRFTLTDNPINQETARIIDTLKNNHTVLNRDAAFILEDSFGWPDRDVLRNVLKDNTILHEASEITASMDFDEKRRKLSALLKSLGENPSDYQKTVLKKALDQCTELRLSHQELTDAHIMHLAEALKTNETVTLLDLFDNNISAEGANMLSNVLLTNKKIVCLRLAMNNIGPDGIRGLAAVLEQNKTLEELDLNGNLLGSGTMRLIKALKNNSTLQRLSLTSVNLHIDTQAASDCLEALKDNHSLLSLSLLNGFAFNERTNNSMGTSSPHLFLALLEQNKTLLALHLPDYRSIDFDTRSKIEGCLERNKKLYQEALEKAYASGAGEALGAHLPSPIARIVGEYLELREEDFGKGVKIAADKKQAEAEALAAKQKAEEEAAAIAAKRKAEEEAAAIAAKQKAEEETAVAAAKQKKEEPVIDKTTPPATPATTPTEKFSLKNTLRAATIAAIAIGVIASAILFAVATPAVAGIVLGAFALAALITFGASTQIKQEPNPAASTVSSTQPSEPPKVVETGAPKTAEPVVQAQPTTPESQSATVRSAPKGQK